MSFTRRSFLAATAAPFATQTVFGQSPKARIARRDCFFGMHFDLHPNDKDHDLGRNLSEEMIEKFLARVKPDFVQYDCKGHVGYLGYPSKVSAPAGTIVKDSLAMWRRGTAKHGVSLFIHFSGVWDSRAVRDHVEWARVRPDGTPDDRLTSTFGPYVDERMIPQLKEAAEKYDLDGAWVDGECWAVAPDYSPAAAKAFRNATGIASLPKGPNERGWSEFLEFNRERFRQYVKHYVDVLHGFRPSFQIASNWLYSTMVPERPDLPVDFLSGDYLGNACISRARLDARYLQSAGKPWDLMAWGFQSGKQGHNHKSAVQLMQEASVVLAQGGGFQIYYVPTRAGYIDSRHIEVMGKVADFCRPRQAVSHKTESVPQVGVLFSKNTLYSKTNRMFGGWGASTDPAQGMVDALIECHYSVDVIPDWKLAEAAARYPFIVAPDWEEIGLAARDVLVKYVRGGGKLLIVGAENAGLFSDLLGVKLMGKPEEQEAWVPGREVFANLAGLWQNVEPAGAEVLAQRFPVFDSTRDGKCAAVVNRIGNGAIAAIFGPIGKRFETTHASAIRELVQGVIERVFQPAVRLDGPPAVEVSLRRKAGKLLVHLGNCTAMQVAEKYAVVDFIPPVGPLGLSLDLPEKPKRVTLEPGGQELQGEWKNGTWTGSVERLEIHSVVAFEV